MSTTPPRRRPSPAVYRRRRLALLLLLLVIVGVVWLLIALARLARTDRALAAIGTACVSAYGVIGALSFGVWQEWWIATGAIGAAACFWFGQGRAEGAVTSLSSKDAAPAGATAYLS